MAVLRAGGWRAAGEVIGVKGERIGHSQGLVENRVDDGAVPIIRRIDQTHRFSDLGLVEKGLRQFAIEAAVENRHDIIQRHLRGNEMPGRIGRDYAEGEGLTTKPQ